MPRWSRIFSCVEPDLEKEYAQRIQKGISQLQCDENASARLSQKFTHVWTISLGGLNDKWRLFITLKNDNLYLLYLMEDHHYKKHLPRVRRLYQKYEHVNWQSEELQPYTLEQQDIAPDTPPLCKEVHFFRNKFLLLSEQQESILGRTGSMLLNGRAGSGKTAMLVFFIKQSILEGKSIAFITNTDRLANKVEKEIDPILNENNAHITSDILTTQKIIKKHNPHLTENKSVSYDYFVKYFEKHKVRLINSFKIFCKFPADLTVKETEYLCIALYQELCLIAPRGYESDENEAQKIYINHHDSFFKTEVEDAPSLKANLLRELALYRETLKDDNKFDLAIEPLQAPNEPLYDIMHLDEVQDILPNIYWWLISLAKDVIIAGDDKQNKGQKPNMVVKQRWLSEKIANELFIVTLDKSYRCSKTVNEVAHFIHKIDANLAGISSTTISFSDENEIGYTEFYIGADEHAEKIRSHLKTYNSSEVLIIASKENFEKVNHEFPGFIVCSPENVAGEEFKYVFLYQPFYYTGKNAFLKINQRYGEYITSSLSKTPKTFVQDNLKQGYKASNNQYMSLLRTLYTVLTRAESEMIILQKQDEKNKIILESWLSEIQATKNENFTYSLGKKSIFNNEISTEEEWIERINDLISKDHFSIQQIKNLVQIHLYVKVIDPISRWEQYVQFLKQNINDVYENLSDNRKKELEDSLLIIDNTTPATKKESLEIIVSKKIKDKEKTPDEIQHFITKTNKVDALTKYLDQSEKFSTLLQFLDYLATEKDLKRLNRNIGKIRTALTKYLSDSIFDTLSLDENQHVFLRLVDADIWCYDYGYHFPSQGLITSWEKTTADIKKSTLWLLMASFHGNSILNKLLKGHKEIQESFSKLSPSILSKKFTESTLECWIQDATSNKKLLVLVYAVKNIPLSNSNELRFFSFLTQHLFNDLSSFADSQNDFLTENEKCIDDIFIHLASTYKKTIGIINQDFKRFYEPSLISCLYTSFFWLTVLNLIILSYFIYDNMNSIETKQFSVSCFVMSTFSLLFKIFCPQKNNPTLFEQISYHMMAFMFNRVFFLLRNKKNTSNFLTKSSEVMCHILSCFHQDDMIDLEDIDQRKMLSCLHTLAKNTDIDKYFFISQTAIMYLLLHATKKIGAHINISSDYGKNLDRTIYSQLTKYDYQDIMKEEPISFLCKTVFSIDYFFDRRTDGVGEFFSDIVALIYSVKHHYSLEKIQEFFCLNLAFDSLIKCSEKPDKNGINKKVLIFSLYKLIVCCERRLRNAAPTSATEIDAIFYIVKNVLHLLRNLSPIEDFFCYGQKDAVLDYDITQDMENTMKKIFYPLIFSFFIIHQRNLLYIFLPLLNHLYYFEEMNFEPSLPNKHLKTETLCESVNQIGYPISMEQIKTYSDPYFKRKWNLFSAVEVDQKKSNDNSPPLASAVI